jgi:hypothetical protein
MTSDDPASRRDIRELLDALVRCNHPKLNAVARVILAHTDCEDTNMPLYPIEYMDDVRNADNLLIDNANCSRSWILKGNNPTLNSLYDALYEESLTDDIIPLILECTGPLVPITFNGRWLTSDVLALARGIREQKAYDRMAILADALQDADCDNDQILDHCRDTAVRHNEHCWVLTRILEGK